MQMIKVMYKALIKPVNTLSGACFHPTDEDEVHAEDNDNNTYTHRSLPPSAAVNIQAVDIQVDDSNTNKYTQWNPPSVS